jgi:hypothetical protein
MFRSIMCSGDDYFGNGDREGAKNKIVQHTCIVSKGNKRCLPATVHEISI